MQKLMSLFMTLTIVLNAGYFLEITASTMEAAVVATKMQYLGATFIPITYCWFMFTYCYEKIPYRLMGVLLVADALILGSIYTSESNHFFYKEVMWVTEGVDHPCLSFTYGPGYNIFFFLSYLLPYGLSLYALIHAVVTNPNRMRGRKYKSLILVSMFPVISMFTYIWKMYLNYDFTPAVMGIALSILVLKVISRRNYDFSRLAAELGSGRRLRRALGEAERMMEHS